MPKITDLTADTTPDGSDVVPFVDVSAGANEKVTVDNLAASTAFSGRYAPLVNADPYSRFRQAYVTDPTAVKIALVGDSTSLIANYPGYFDKIKEHFRDGGSLEGMLNANLISGGNNGETAAGWNTGADTGYSIAELTADAPDLVVYSFGINDVRLGGVSTATLISRIQTSIDLIQAALPDADIMLRMPNSLLNTGPYVSGITGQAASDILFESYIYFIDRIAHVGVLDTQATIFGRVSPATSPLMTDQLHPQNYGQWLVGDAIAKAIGSGCAIGCIGPRMDMVNQQHQGYKIRLSSAGNGYIDFGAATNWSDAPGTEVPLKAGDVLYVEGYGSIDLTGATFANTSGTNIRIIKTGDWTAVQNKFAYLVHDRPVGIQRGRYWRTIDPNSVAAGAFGTVSTTITGATTENGVVAQPPTSFSSLELNWSAYVSAADTVTIRYHNPTGSSIDPASGSWRFWLAN